MALLKSLILAFALLSAATGRADDPSSLSTEEMVKRINARYDDFFRWHRAQEERWERLRAGVGERKKMEKEHAREMEKAREAYVKARKERPNDEALRLRFETAQKERAAHMEMLRRRYVQQRDTAEQYMLKGRMIPELKEFDLENY